MSYAPSRRGWASSVEQTLRDGGFDAYLPNSYTPHGGLGHSVVYYGPGHKEQAGEISVASGVSPAPEALPRPAEFTDCPSEVALVLAD